MSKQSAVSEMVEEARARRRAEEEARHVMGAVPWIELAIILPVFVCVVMALVAVLR